MDPAEVKQDVERKDVRDFCSQNGIRKLSVFEPILRDDSGLISDVAALVEFEKGEAVGYIGLGALERELSQIVGRKVEIHTPNGLPKRLRDRVLQKAEVLYGE